MKFLFGAKIPALILAFLAITQLSFISASSVFADQIQNMTVSAVVPPRVSDFQFSLDKTGASNPSTENELSYQITYGALESAGMPTDTTIAVYFGDNMDYVDYSATEAYRSTSPIIDKTNKTISWLIPSLPNGMINQKVKFQLKPKTILNQPENSLITVSAKMNNQYIKMPEQTLTNLLVIYLSNLNYGKNRNEVLISELSPLLK